MIKVSKRALNSPFSPIRKLTPFAGKAQKKGVEIFNLNIGQPDMETPKIFYKKIKEYSYKTLSYAPSAGFKKVRQAWQKYYKKFGINFSIDEILVTTGGSEAIIFSFLAICDPGDEIIVFEPVYPNYITFGKMASVKLVPVTLKIENAFHFPDRKKIIKNISKRTKAILICNPNNPTGAVYTKRELKTIVDISKEYNLFIIADEVYREFIFNGKKHISLMHFSKVRNQVVLIDSVSKRFNICGARIGCLASKNKEIINSALKFAQGRLSSPTLEQIAVIPLLEDPQKYIRPVLKRYRIARDIVIKNLYDKKGCFCFEPEGAFYCMVRLPVEDTERFCQWLLEKYDLDKNTVMLAPGSGFYVSKNFGKDEVRIAFVLKTDRMKKAMEILKKGIDIYNKDLNLK